MTQSDGETTWMRVLEEASLWCVRTASGPLNEEEQSEFDRWIEASDIHREALDDTLRTWHGLNQVRCEPDILNLRSRALAAFRETNRPGLMPEPPAQRWIGLRPLAAMVASLLFLIIGYATYSYFSFETYQTGTGERRVVQLADGSRISMDADTEVGVRYSGGRRELALRRGRAKFDVAKDALQPFTVSAANRIVVATGTEFSVELLGRDLHVILYEGRVSVVPRVENTRLTTDSLWPQSSRREVQLTPGKELISGVDDNRQAVVMTDPSRSLTWESGLLSFDDEPLGMAIERVNRYSKVKIAIGDARAASLLVNGVYPSGDMQAFLEGIAGVLPVRIKLYPDGSPVGAAIYSAAPRGRG